MFRTIRGDSAMRRYTKTKTAIHCLLLTTIMGSMGACADAYSATTTTDPRLEIATRTVKYADLDLTRNAGAATLYLRIKSAAREVCEPISFTYAWKSVATAHRCMDQAIFRAVADVNAPLLTSYYQGKAAELRLAISQ
jgi:UrcA family protein